MKQIEIEKQVLQKITPTERYRKKLDRITQELKEEILHEIKKRKLPVEIELVGSISKDTFLQDNMDIDFFIKFPTFYHKERIAKQAVSIGKNILKNTEESYAEHPYLRGYYKDYKAEIVPCYKIEKASQRLSAVDRTPLHTKYIIENITEKQRQEVRLFKQFLKGINCYGAEAEIEGFSGYLCEILIIKFDTFKGLIQNAQKWKTGEKISIKNGKHPSFDTSLIFIDPVDPNRNVASAVSKEKFKLFIYACKEYQKNPMITYFFPNKVKPWELEKIKKTIEKENIQYIGINIEKPDIISENLYPQVRKAVKSIWESCERNDFKIFDMQFYIDEEIQKIFIIIKIEKGLLSNTFIHSGPPVKLKKNADDFIRRWKDDPQVTKKPYEKNGRLLVELERDYTKIDDFLKNQIKNLSLGKHLDKVFQKKFNILNLDKLLVQNHREFWTKYLDGKMSWER